MQPPSPREITVLRLLAWGHTNKEIATRPEELSVKTSESHRSTRDRAALVRYAVEKDEAHRPRDPADRNRELPTTS